MFISFKKNQPNTLDLIQKNRNRQNISQIEHSMNKTP